MGGAQTVLRIRTAQQCFQSKAKGVIAPFSVSPFHLWNELRVRCALSFLCTQRGSFALRQIQKNKSTKETSHVTVVEALFRGRVGFDKF
jgi:hypothetical protein